MFSKQASILLVDDERSIVNLLSEDLTEEGYNCALAFTGEKALERLAMGNIDVVLLDLKLPGISGMDVLKKMKSNYPETIVIVVTASGDAQTAVEAMKIGAIDYITKPFEMERVNSSIKEALKMKAAWRDESVFQKERAEAGDTEMDWACYLDDIADGVETRLDSLTGHVMALTVIDGTISIARSLDIPDEQIEKWTDVRRKRIERIKILDTQLEKVEQSPVA